MKRTKILIATGLAGESYLEEEDIKNFLKTELKRSNLSVISLEVLGY